MLPEGYTYETTEEGFSLTVPLTCPVGEARSLAVTAALWVRDAVGGTARIHWPNHVIADGKRVCAVRCAALSAGGLRFDFHPSPEVGLPADFAAAVCRNAAEAMAGYPENRPQLLQRYCEFCDTVMKFVDTSYRGMPIYGFAFAVDRHGGLMVMTQESRTVLTIYGGEAVIADKRDQQPPDLPPTPRL